MSPDEYLVRNDINLPPAQKPSGNYVPFKCLGNLLYVAGHGPRSLAGDYICGRVTAETDLTVAYSAARSAGLNMLATLKEHLGSLDKVESFVKVLGMVNSTADFAKHPKVIDGFSDPVHEVFGQAGRHARSAVGMGSLPQGIMVEIEAILVLKTPLA